MITRRVNTTVELLYALASNDCAEIVLANALEELPTIKLRPGQSLRAVEGRRAVLKFQERTDGICCTANNSIADIDLKVSREHRAIFNDTSYEHLGELNISKVTTVGCVQVVAKGDLMQGTLRISGLHILDADCRSRKERPHAYGVDVIQGAFTLWNMQTKKASSLQATLHDISIGVAGAPTSGTGIFICGSKEHGTNVVVDILRTGAIYSDGGIGTDVPDVISGGVLVLYGAHVDSLENAGPVETFGNNDMALDNWGSVGTWIARGTVTTRRTSAIGFVNFGTVTELRIEALVETFGTGARGFNVYAGTVDRAEFERIVTHGDGAVGIQISQPVGDIRVNDGVETFGATGPSLVKGVFTQLSAIPISIKRGAKLRELVVHGGLKTHEPSIAPVELEGEIANLIISDGIGLCESALSDSTKPLKEV